MLQIINNVAGALREPATAKLSEFTGRFHYGDI